VDEIAASYQHYFDKGNRVIPLLSIGLACSDPDSPSVRPTESGLRLGSGFEYPFSNGLSLVASGDYTVPADVDETDFIDAFHAEGWAIRLGLR
jgi:hypothetical protein